MFVIKRKYVIKAYTALIALVILITAVFAKSHFEDVEKQKNEKEHFASSISNIGNSVSEIQLLFEKGIALNNFTDIKSEIYLNCKHVRNSLFQLQYDFPKTTEWFFDLAEYSKTEMNDQSKNTAYYEELKKAYTVLFENCNTNDIPKSISEIEALFTKKLSQSEISELSRQLESEYYILKNQIKWSKKDVSNLAKDIMNSPISPNDFAGNFHLPSVSSFHSKNAYANVFGSGLFLASMATENISSPGEILLTHPKMYADEYIKEYAPYLSEPICVFSKVTNRNAYYVYCPQVWLKDTKILNYNETVSLAVNINNGNLTAFDSTNFLKKHANRIMLAKPISIPKELPSDLKDKNTLSVYTVYIGSDFFFEYKIKTNESAIFYLVSVDNGSAKIYTQDEYINLITKN